MASEHERIYDGNRAKEVLENEQFQAAFDAVEQDIIDKWTNSPARDAAGRESLWQYLMLLRKVKAQLTGTMETGKLAELDLKHKQSMLDRVRTGLGL